MTRYRLEIWPTANPDKVMRKHVNKDCKMCAVKQAVTLASGYQKGMHLPDGAVRWSVSRQSGHLRGWVILHHSGQPIAALAFNHAH